MARSYSVPHAGTAYIEKGCLVIEVGLIMNSLGSLRNNTSVLLTILGLVPGELKTCQQICKPAERFAYVTCIDLTIVLQPSDRILRSVDN